MPIDFPPRTPNVPDTNPITLGSKRYLWTGEQWAAYNPALTTQNTSTVNLTYTNGVLQANLAETATVTVPANGTTASFGIKPTGTYIISYVNGHNSLFANTAGNTTAGANRVTLRYAFESSNTQVSHILLNTIRSFVFYQNGGAAITMTLIDSGYGDNAGPGIEYRLTRIQ